MAIQLIASDIDGTFLNDKNDFDHEHFSRLLQEFKQRNIQFTVASGNQYAHCLDVMGEFQDQVSYVVEDGALTVVNGRVLDENPIKAGQLKDVVDYLQTTKAFSDAHIILSTREKAYTNTSIEDPEWSASSYFYRNLEAVENFHNINDPIYKIDVHWSNKDSVRPIAELMKKDLGSDLSSVMSGFSGIDITMPHVTKAHGLAQLQDYFKAGMDETLAFGDTQNDVAMLKEARLGYAMKNAEVEAIEATHLITPKDNNHSGVFDVIDQVLNGDIK